MYASIISDLDGTGSFSPKEQSIYQ